MSSLSESSKVIFSVFCFQGDANVCQALIEHGLDVNQEAITPPFNLKMKPICQAVRLQNMVITQQLIEAGAELDGYDTL